MSNKFVVFVMFSTICLFGCAKAQVSSGNVKSDVSKVETVAKIEKIKNSAKVIHVLVALCDNVNQGIVPVPAHLGNGEDTAKNLYWGAAYGVKAFFSKSKDWEKIADIPNPKTDVLERVVFKHRTQNIYLVADAYRGAKIKQTIQDFVEFSAGKGLENVEIKGKPTIQIGGSANLTVYIGHNGLMEFSLDEIPAKQDNEKRDAIMLACASKNYFAEHLQKTGAKPLLWTTNLMAPEAYILHSAIEGWIAGKTDAEIRIMAAAAYAKYQKISPKSAQRLFATGF